MQYYRIKDRLGQLAHPNTRHPYTSKKEEEEEEEQKTYKSTKNILSTCKPEDATKSVEPLFQKHRILSNIIS